MPLCFAFKAVATSRTYGCGRPTSKVLSSFKSCPISVSGCHPPRPEGRHCGAFCFSVTQCPVARSAAFPCGARSRRESERWFVGAAIMTAVVYCRFRIDSKTTICRAAYSEKIGTLGACSSSQRGGHAPAKSVRTFHLKRCCAWPRTKGGLLFNRSVADNTSEKLSRPRQVGHRVGAGIHLAASAYWIGKVSFANFAHET
jgi:hypothetical protein